MISIERLREVFEAACRLETDEQRQTFLDENCGSDHVLRERVEALLVADRDAGSFLQDDAQVDAMIESDPNSELVGPKVGMVIGPYKLCEQLAEGGMGVVYVAEQTEPVRRKVALKIIKPGMATREFIARFEAERQTLAMMEHPHIARIIDAGTTDYGQPFFVMELVLGVPITQYCDEREMGTRARLLLFAKVCRAVQHAHQKGIIHRDIKPSNVLVAEIDGRAIPKVIDFGVAKAVGASMADQTVYTQVSQMVGTPLYMSPEQANLGVLDIDTRSDCYSLGVLLYELLTGCTPFDRESLKKFGIDEFRRMIREEEATRPSAMVSTLQAQALSTVAARRSCDPRKLSDSLRGELDWIVMKSMEKDRNRRYESASAFAEDVERYLNDQAVLACPPSRLYRTRKFARRYRAAIAIGIMFVAVMLAGMVGTTWQMLRAIAAEGEATAQSQTAQQQAAFAMSEAKRAESEAAIAKAVNDFLNEDLLAQADPFKAVAPDPDIRLRDVIDRAAEQVTNRFDDQPLVKAAIQMTLSATYESLGESTAALSLARDSHEIREHQLGSDDQQTLASLEAVGWAQFRQGNYQDAESILKEVYEKQRRYLGEEHDATLLTLGNLGTVIQALGRHAEALEIHRRVLASRRAMVGGLKDKRLAQVLGELASSLSSLEQFDEAIEAHREELAIYEKLSNRAGQAFAMGNLAFIYGRQGDLARSEECLKKSLELKTDVLGRDHYWTVTDLSNLGNIMTMGGRLAEAEGYFRETLEIRRRTLGADDSNTLLTMSHLAGTLLRLERIDEALSLSRERLAILRSAYGEEDPQVIRQLAMLARMLVEQELYEEAHRCYQEAIASCQQIRIKQPDDYRNLTSLGATQCDAGSSLNSQKDYAQASKYFEDAIDSLTIAADSGSSNSAKIFLGYAHWGLGRSLRRLGQYPESLAEFQSASALVGSENQTGVELERLTTLAASGSGELAVAGTEKLLTEINPEPSVWYDAARIYALVARSYANSNSATNAERELSKSLAVRALQSLRKASDAGYFNQPTMVSLLETEEDFAELQEQAEYISILHDLRAQFSVSAEQQKTQ